MLLLRPEALAGGALLRAMVPLREVRRPSISRANGSCFSSGAVDPIVPPENSRRLAAILRAAAKADVQAQTLPGGHGLTPQDVSLTQNWLIERSHLSH